VGNVLVREFGLINVEVPILVFYSVLISVQMIAFSFVALKMVLCFSFGSSENFHFKFALFSVFKIVANSLV